MPSGGRYLGEAGSNPAICPRAKARKGPLTMKVTVEVSEKTIGYVLDDAGSAIAYWAKKADRKAAFVLSVYDREQWYRVAVRRALETMAVKAPKHFGRLLAGDYDQATCDLFVQYGCFGEVVYQ